MPLRLCRALAAALLLCVCTAGCAPVRTRAPAPLPRAAASSGGGTAGPPAAHAENGASTAPAAGTAVVDTAYGFSFRVPAGWRVSSADGQPVGRSADLALTPPGPPRNEAMHVRVCLGGGVCPQTYTFKVLKTTRAPAVLAGTPAIRFDDTRSTVTGTRVWHQFHVVATHGRHTYDVSVDAPMGQAATPAAYAALLLSWRWLPCPRPGRRSPPSAC